MTRAKAKYLSGDEQVAGAVDEGARAQLRKVAELLELPCHDHYPNGMKRRLCKGCEQQLRREAGL